MLMETAEERSCAHSRAVRQADSSLTNQMSLAAIRFVHEQR